MKFPGAYRVFMNKAMRAACAGVKTGQTPFGACIVKNGHAVSVAHNRVWQSRDITAHAEMVAIREACRTLGTVDLSGCLIFSTCEPCPMCFSACHWARIEAIVYGATINDAKKAGFNELLLSNRQLKTMSGSRVRIVPFFMREENLRLFERWARQKEKRVY